MRILSTQKHHYAHSIICGCSGTVHGEDGILWARYLRSMQETIHVYGAESETTRADHVLHLWGKQFLRLHYRMRLQQQQSSESNLQEASLS
jgi:hypothetical protein